MIMDKNTLLSSAQALTTTAYSTYSYDLSVARDLGIGDNDIGIFIRVIAALTGGTSVQFQFITSANADLSSETVIVSTPAIAAASLTAGTEWLRIDVPAISLAASVQRYIGFKYTIVGTFGAGTVTAGFILEPREGLVYYASGLNTGGY